MSSTSTKMLNAADLAAVRQAKYDKRKRMNLLALALSLAAMLFGVFWLVWILWETVRQGVGGLSFALFSQMTPPPNDEGGIANAIWGSLMMVALATFVGTPIGVMAGVYLAEYDKKSWLAGATRFVNDILLSAPSIVIGLFVYTVVVIRLKSFSGIAGDCAGADCDSRGHSHYGKHAGAGACQLARSGLCAGYAQVEGHHHGHAACRTGRCDYRCAAGRGPYCG